MTPERWQQVTEIFEAALEREPGERGAYLAKTCDDEVLRSEVESLLFAHQRAGSFIAEPALDGMPLMNPAKGTDVTSRSIGDLTGQRLGHYQLQEKLGEGGMGVVYKARDPRLERSVAIKVLRSESVANPERKKRFVAEARAASGLNHPNIITIYDIGQAQDLDFIAMEYVAGQTLDQPIARGGLQLSDALNLAIQIADALATAHAAGIIHRDLKPGNIMVNEKGQVKVLDFGLAKLTVKPKVEEWGTAQREQAISQTEEGMILGTVSYMSPEQVEGKRLDARSDIFSFGSLLYEMVTGQKAFQGDSKILALSAILSKDPKPASEIRTDIPTDLEKIINRCLRKEPEQRFQHMAEVKGALEELKEGMPSGSGQVPEQMKKESASKTARESVVGWPARRAWAWLGAALIVVALVVVAWFARGTARTPAPTPEVIPLTSYEGYEGSPSFSPDGNQVAFSWNGEKQDNYDIYVKLIDSSPYLRLTTDPAGDISPAVSPDGRSIGFIRLGNERAAFIVVPSIGGPERVVADLALPRRTTGMRVFSWFPDGKWVVVEGLALLSVETGERRNLTSPPTEGAPDYSPTVSPDGRTVGFARNPEGRMDSSIYLLDLTEDLKPKGEPRRLSFVEGNSHVPAWMPNGQEIVFATGLGNGIRLWRMPVSGGKEPELLSFGARGEPDCPTISRNGKRLAYQENVSSQSDIWRLPLSSPGVASGPLARFIASTRNEGAAVYSPDGKRIAFVSDRSGNYGIWVCDSDGNNAIQLFVQAGAVSSYPQWSPDGQRIAFNSGLNGNGDIHVIRANGGRPIRLTTDSADDIAPSWSRDGNWVYFESRRTGRWEIWKVLAGGGEAVQVTRNGGGAIASESLDGRSIYYLKFSADWVRSTLWKMPVNGGEESQVLPSVVLRAFCLAKDGIYFIPGPGPSAVRESPAQFLSFATGKVKTVAPIPRPYVEISVSPDGRFLLLTQFEEEGSDLMLVENFR